MGNYKTIAEHTVDIDLLIDPGKYILDAGCRGMGFRNEFGGYHNVYSIDIDDLLDESYLKVGIGPITGWGGVSKHSDPQARQLTEGSTVPIHTTETLKELLSVPHWDLIKLDIEGMEYEVLKQAKHPIAKQVSVEFHIHCGQTKEEIDELLQYLEQWYDIPVKVYEQRHGLPANYWDCLLVAK
jgi:hypothetical protein